MAQKKSAPQLRGDNGRFIGPNMTEYGEKRWKTPTRKGQYAGPKGTPIMAGVLDIDGTLQDWGSKASQKVLDWMATVEKRYPDMVWLVITARTHDYDYQRSFDWLVSHVPYPFIGPFHRAADDPRYASEFKRELAQGFEDMGLYQIVAAADDNAFVNKMWKHWAVTHFANPADFDLLETEYTPYQGWRSELPSTRSYTYGAPAYSLYTSPTGQSYYSRYAPAGADEAVQGALAAMEDRAPSQSQFDQADDERWELEGEVYANYPDLGYDEIEDMDIEVLRQMIAAVDLPDTAPLDVAEIWAELGEQPFTAPAGGQEVVA